MTYPFVVAAHDYGARKGPPLAFLIHVAEGGGTVGFLAGDNARGVSVHYVIERTGRTVQMLREDRASGSVNPRDIRTTDDPDGFYGASVARAVLGDWARDPNSAVISLEIEGFAKDGPNAAQKAALALLVADVRSRHPRIGLLGHRDFADYKACPGKLIPWDVLGGHGPAQEDDMPLLSMKPDSTETGVAIIRPIGAHYILADNRRIAVKGGEDRNVVGTYRLAKPLDTHPGDRQTLLAVSVPNEPGWGFLLAADTDWPTGRDKAATADCGAAVNETVNKALDAIEAAHTAVEGLRP